MKLYRHSEDIYRLELPMPLLGSVNAYLVRGERGYTIIDTGMRSEQAIEQWEGIIAGGIAIERVIVTHCHPDHMGLAGWLQQRFRVPVHIPRRGFERMKEAELLLRSAPAGDGRPLPLFALHEGPLYPAAAMWKSIVEDAFEPDGLLEEGQNIRIGSYSFRVIGTPGHSHDHLCFYSAELKQMFTGDHVLEGPSPFLSITSEADGDPLGDYLQALDSVARFDIDCVFPGHGEPFRTLKMRAEEIRRNHEFRMEQLLDHLTCEGLTAGQMTRRVYGDDSGSGKRFMEFQVTLARLIHLERMGRVKGVEREGKVVFTRVP
ncbi:MBL fold metallo-hydrolase [Paenibacillus sp.]|uniref:MBL fold metallo-hydrolase n=1 Tax=Paenibacillus sp. TaxID=58172 RepID=UPI002D35073B|nr:MBL fold metallo-hydrolase [Paenibacillus sp.]HZG83750.1 MBL fold metallo-hydrolase [Paenibacillus sp.]